MSTIFDQDFAMYAIGENADMHAIVEFVTTTVVEELRHLSDGVMGICYLPLLENDAEMYFDFLGIEEFALYDDFIGEVDQCLAGIKVDKGHLLWKGRYLPNAVDDHMRFLAWRVFNEFGQGETFCAGFLSNGSVQYGKRIVTRYDASQLPPVYEKSKN
jgi:hypothetical protein